MRASEFPHPQQRHPMYPCPIPSRPPAASASRLTVRKNFTVPRLRRLAVLFLPGLLLLPACGKREAAVEAGIRTQTLIVGNGHEPQDLDPHVTSGSEAVIAGALFEGLVTQDPATGQPAPGVAHAWEMSADRLTYTFRLRPEARWSDGKPVTAEDFVRSAQRVLTPSLGAERAEAFSLVAGAREFSSGKTKDFSRVGIRALDPLTLQVTLSTPAQHFFNKVFESGWLPVPVHVVSRHGGMEKRGSAWTRPGNLVGNGPYVLTAWKPNAHVEVAKSPTYWDRARVRLERIRFLPIENADTEERMFRSGQLHVTASLPPTKIEVWRRERPAEVRVLAKQRSIVIDVNPTRPPFTDARVRRALALAVDRTRLAAVLGGGRTPARNYTPPNRVDYAPADSFRDDPVEARRLLAEAGFPGGKGFPRVDINYTGIQQANLVLEALQEMWRKELGLEVGLLAQEWSTWLDAEKTGNYHLFWTPWNFSYPHGFFENHRTGNPLSYTLWSNADYDRILAQAASAMDIRERNALFAELEKILAREFPAIPLYFDVATYLKHPAVRGWPDNPDFGVWWKQVWLE